MTKDLLWTVLVLLIGMFFGLIGTFKLLEHTENEFVKRGQIEALTGNIKYAIYEHADKTVTWEWIGTN